MASATYSIATYCHWGGDENNNAALHIAYTISDNAIATESDQTICPQLGTFLSQKVMVTTCISKIWEAFSYRPVCACVVSELRRYNISLFQCMIGWSAHVAYPNGRFPCVSVWVGEYVSEQYKSHKWQREEKIILSQCSGNGSWGWGWGGGGGGRDTLPFGTHVLEGQRCIHYIIQINNKDKYTRPEWFQFNFLLSNPTNYQSNNLIVGLRRNGIYSRRGPQGGMVQNNNPQKRQSTERSVVLCS